MHRTVDMLHVDGGCGKLSARFFGAHFIKGDIV
jgi:hypothetical protein